ncbi:MAG: tetratricopeptide (TPR) repeat protein [Clostridium sp.]|jgi:tetratricopeptide (TPR) repeat protein
MKSKFELKIELGDLQVKNGDIDESLKYFKSAYDIAVLLEDKKYQVDALIRITESYFQMGKIEISIKYAGVVEELLRDLDYVKGKLDISLYLLKLYDVRNENYKAREIGNEALKLCTEEHIIYKGRILNGLAMVYREIASVDEQLDLLKQSLACFEKENCLRGILGVLNNIGASYSDKLQDNEKALEYFFKLKEQSEDSNYSEFNVYAYFNIGEAYYKCLRFDEAIYWCKLGLEKAVGAHMEPMVFYSYVILTSINLSINNYKEAYEYFNLASEELTTFPDQGVRLPWYYKSAASLYLEFGETNKARYNIKQGLNMLGEEETIIKWNTGIVYEFMKLKEAKNKTDILGAIEGITYILSKYKSPKVISDIVYEVALELVELEQRELAFKLVDEYEEMAIENGYISLKHKYIEALRCNNEEKEQMLNSTLELAAEKQNSKLQLKICNSLGECYFKEDDYVKAISCYVDACIQVKNIVFSVPVEFRIQFINSNNMLKYFNILAQAKMSDSKLDGNNYKKYDCINNENELIEFFEDLDKIIL